MDCTSLNACQETQKCLVIYAIKEGRPTDPHAYDVTRSGLCSVGCFTTPWPTGLNASGPAVGAEGASFVRDVGLHGSDMEVFVSLKASVRSFL